MVNPIKPAPSSFEYLRGLDRAIHIEEEGRHTLPTTPASKIAASQTIATMLRHLREHRDYQLTYGVIDHGALLNMANLEIDALKQELQDTQRLRREHDKAVSVAAFGIVLAIVSWALLAILLW